MERTMCRTQVRKGIFTGGHFAGTVLLVLAGLLFVKVMTVPIADASPIQNPSGDPIAVASGETVPKHMNVWESETVEIADQAVPLSSSPDRAITCPSSKQYEMQQEAWTDELGLRRYGDYYMVALGTFYAQNCGETFRITLDSGFSFDVITGDIKDDKHTDEKHQHRNGVIVEFIVDSKAISKTCRVMGDMSHAGFSGKIESIQRLWAD